MVIIIWMFSEWFMPILAFWQKLHRLLKKHATEFTLKVFQINLNQILNLNYERQLHFIKSANSLALIHNFSIYRVESHIFPHIAVIRWFGVMITRSAHRLYIRSGRSHWDVTHWFVDYGFEASSSAFWHLVFFGRRHLVFCNQKWQEREELSTTEHSIRHF